MVHRFPTLVQTFNELQLNRFSNYRHETVITFMLELLELLKIEEYPCSVSKQSPGRH